MTYRQLPEDCATLKSADNNGRFHSKIDDMSERVSEFGRLVDEARIPNPSMLDTPEPPSEIKFDKYELSTKKCAEIVEAGLIAKGAIYSLGAQEAFDDSEKCSEIIDRNATKINKE